MKANRKLWALLALYVIVLAVFAGVVARSTKAPTTETAKPGVVTTFKNEKLPIQGSSPRLQAN